MGSKGQLLEWDREYEEREPTHRHCSPLYGLHPAHEITPDGTPELAKAARRSLELRGDEGTGWSLGWKINFWARLGEGERYRYGLTLVGLVSPARRAGDLLSAATTMTGSKRNIRERVDMIVKKPNNTAVSLDAVLLLVAFTTACAFTGWPRCWSQHTTRAS